LLKLVLYCEEFGDGKICLLIRKGSILLPCLIADKAAVKFGVRREGKVNSSLHGFEINFLRILNSSDQKLRGQGYFLLFIDKLHFRPKYKLPL
jgi:hypothetical protein